MKLVLYVHDLFLEIGHSNALIETINNLPPEEVEEITVVAFTSDSLEKLFPKHKAIKTFVQVPFPRIYPFIFKFLFYYAWAYSYTLLKLDRSHIKVGIGISYPWANIVNIQFVHKQWGDFYLKTLTGSWLKKIYKNILFFFYELFEEKLYGNREIYFSSLSQFTTDYIRKEFGVSDSHVVTNYSGVNLSKFEIPTESKKELKSKLLAHHPELARVDVEQPIYLFVGAYERKGLPLILEKFRALNHGQLIVVGKSESTNSVKLTDENIFQIEYTAHVSDFYALADAFVFASIYEPFGLVILEAAAMGLELFITKECVGASELLEDMVDIHLFENQSDFRIEKIDVRDSELKKKVRGQRMLKLDNYSWQQTGDCFYNLLKKF